jgi:hypothetical protein
VTTPAPSPACSQVDKPADRSGPSRKAIIGWGVSMLAVIGLAWLVGGIVWPTWEVRSSVHSALDRQSVFLSPIDDTDVVWEPSGAVEALGGRQVSAGRIDQYMKLPEWLRKNSRPLWKQRLVAMLGECGEHGASVLSELVAHEDTEVRQAARKIRKLLEIDLRVRPGMAQQEVRDIAGPPDKITRFADPSPRKGWRYVVWKYGTHPCRLIFFLKGRACPSPPGVEYWDVFPEERPPEKELPLV